MSEPSRRVSERALKAREVEALTFSYTQAPPPGASSVVRVLVALVVLGALLWLRT